MKTLSVFALALFGAACSPSLSTSSNGQSLTQAADDDDGTTVPLDGGVVVVADAADGSGSDPGGGSDGSGTTGDPGNPGSGSAGSGDPGDPGDPGSGSDPGDPGSGSDPGDPGSGSDPGDPGDGSGSDPGGSGSDPGDGSGSGSACTPPPPDSPELDRALQCVELLSNARVSYEAQLDAVAAGYTLPPATPGDGNPTPLDVVVVAAALAAGPGGAALFDLPDYASIAIQKLATFENAFYVDRVLPDYDLLSCTFALSALPQRDGQFGDSYGGGSYGGGGDPINTCLGDDPKPPPQPGINCMGVIVTTWVSYTGGELKKDDTAKCVDYDNPIASTVATGLTGPTAVASGGSRKDAMQSRRGDNCEQASPLLQNFDMGIAVKPAAMFVPQQILTNNNGTYAWKDNNGKMLYYIYPDDKGKPQKVGAQCKKATEITMRTTASMSLPYYVWAAVMNDKNGYSGGSDAYQSLVDIDQKCYGPGTNVTNPGAFSVIPSEVENKMSLKVVKDCTGETAWNGNVSVGASMGKDPGGSFGFSGGVTTTTRCAQNRDIDNFGDGGCFANQNFGNVALTTKPQNGPFAIGALFQMFNPNDPAPATAPVNFLSMGMQLISAQVRNVSSISTDAKGVGGTGYATMLTNRKKPTDKPGKVNAKLEMGAPSCALIAGGQAGAATECKVPVANWPFTPDNYAKKVPDAQKLSDSFDATVKMLSDAAAR